MKTIVTHTGTGLGIVQTIMGKFDVRVVTVYSVEQLKGLKFDGVLLLGGRDINTQLYGEQNHFSDVPNLRRDEVEVEMVNRAVHNGLPLMGICRGMQLLATQFGGALYQDIWAQKVTSFHPRTHSIEFFGPMKEHFSMFKRVNSLHHQAVSDVPAGFKVVARAHDGIVEGIWRPGVLGVQFHPELLFAQDDIRWANIFRWFIGGLK